MKVNYMEYKEAIDFTGVKAGDMLVEHTEVKLYNYLILKDRKDFKLLRLSDMWLMDKQSADFNELINYYFMYSTIVEIVPADRVSINIATTNKLILEGDK